MKRRGYRKITSKIIVMTVVYNVTFTTFLRETLLRVSDFLTRRIKGEER